MIELIKRIIKRTPLYPVIYRIRMAHFFREWTVQNEKELNFYRKFIKPDDLVFDVGANIGSRTKIFLKLNTKVVAFEPQKICIDYLKYVLKKEENITLVRKALGVRTDKGTIILSDSHTLSTLSTEWIEHVKNSGRFNQWETWKDNARQTVQITTLDESIREYGIPKFIKIDVEGYEYEVLLGLSQPIEFISIEFAAENIKNTYRCIDYLASLSEAMFQISLSVSMHLEHDSWVSAEKVKETLSNLISEDSLVWGDIYIKSSNLSTYHNSV